MARLVIGTSKTPATAAMVRDIAPASYRVFEKDTNGKLVSSTSTPFIPLPAGTKDIDDYLFSKIYYYTPSSVLSGAIDLSSLEQVSGSYALYYAFFECSGITSINLGLLSEIRGSHAFEGAFGYCTGVTNINLSSLTTISGVYSCQQMFQRCENIVGLDLSVLTSITMQYGCYAMFTECYSLTTVNFCSLTILTSNRALYSMFSGCRSLTTLSFPSLTPSSFGSQTSQFNSMLSGVTGCTVHFPSNIQTKIGSWSDVTNGFSGTNTTVLFDLPATVTLTGADTVTYTRNPKYDTATALAWKVGAYGTTDFTPAYYTSGTTDPQANDTIYSDSACTTTVTTISSIA